MMAVGIEAQEIQQINASIVDAAALCSADTPDDYLTYATLLELQLEKIQFFSLQAQGQVFDCILETLLPFSPQKPILHHIGWDLLRRLVPFLSTPEEIRVKASFLLDQITLYGNPKETYVMALELLEAWRPANDYGLYKFGKLLHILGASIAMIDTPTRSKFMLQTFRVAAKHLRKLEKIRFSKFSKPQAEQQESDDLLEEMERLLGHLTQSLKTLLARNEHLQSTPEILAEIPGGNEKEKQHYLFAFIFFEVLGLTVRQQRELENRLKCPFSQETYQSTKGAVYDFAELATTIHLDPMTILRYAKQNEGEEQVPDPHGTEPEDHEDNRHPPLSLKGIGTYLFLCLTGPKPLFPMVYSPTEVLSATIPPLLVLFETELEGSLKSLSVLKRVLSGIAPEAMDSAKLGTEKHLVQFFEGLVSLMAQCPDANQRDSAFRSFSVALSLFDEIGRFTLLRDLSARCPFPSAKSVLIGSVKDNVASSLGHEGKGKLFSGPAVLDLVTPFLRLDIESLSASRLLESFDVYVGSANLLLFLLLRDSPSTNQTGVWNSDFREATEKRFMRPLRSGVEDLKREIQSERALLTGMVASPQEASQGEMTPTEKLQALQVQDFNVFILESALQRIDDALAKAD